jgi:hypothetical protein
MKITVGRNSVFAKDYDIGTVLYLNEQGQLHRGDGSAMITLDGGEYWYQNGLRHRVGGPAAVDTAGQEWWINGRLHRDGDEPAIIEFQIKMKKWYKYGHLHRDGDLPAVEGPNEKHWFKNGLRHRGGDLPAYLKNGDQIWFQDNEKHRDRGPACIWKNGRKDWCFKGNFIFSEDEDGIFRLVDTHPLTVEQQEFLIWNRPDLINSEIPYLDSGLALKYSRELELSKVDL